MHVFEVHDEDRRSCHSPYSTCLATCAESGKWQRALTMLEEMRGTGLEQARLRSGTASDAVSEKPLGSYVSKFS